MTNLGLFPSALPFREREKEIEGIYRVLSTLPMEMNRLGMVNTVQFKNLWDKKDLQVIMGLGI